MIANELLDLRARLESAGMVVVQDPDHLTVRLPYFCSVRVYFVDGHLKFDPYFGMVPRVRATAIKGAAMFGLSVSVMKLGTSYLVGMLVLLILAGVYDIVRWLITEQTITRTVMLDAIAGRVAETRMVGQGVPWDRASGVADRDRARAD